MVGNVIVQRLPAREWTGRLTRECCRHNSGSKEGDKAGTSSANNKFTRSAGVVTGGKATRAYSSRHNTKARR